MMKKNDLAKLMDFAVLALRWYLAFYMIDYGWGKMTGGQFGIQNPEILEKPLKEVDKFYLAWYLFGMDKTFDIGVGLMQVAGGILIVINRTLLLGALLLLPILCQIFLVDLAFTDNIFGPNLWLRLLGMIAADVLILMYYRDRMMLIWGHLTKDISTRFPYPWWVFLLMPLVGMLVDFLMAIVFIPVKWLMGMF
jgi:uncharacterized membrane protein YphA (DoxX/SURF4 family)